MVPSEPQAGLGGTTVERECVVSMGRADSGRRDASPHKSEHPLSSAERRDGKKAAGKARSQEQ